MQLGSVRLNLFDTAGVREVGADGDAIEAEGIRRSWRKLDEAGLVLAVFDAAQPLSDDDLELARRCQGRPAIAVLNKQDLAGETDVPRGTLEPYFKKIVPMCARDAVGLQALTDAVADLLGAAGPGGCAVVQCPPIGRRDPRERCAGGGNFGAAERLWAGRRRGVFDGRLAGAV